MIGSTFHETLEYTQRQKIDSHEDRPLSGRIEYLQDAAAPKVLEEAGGKDEIRWDVGGDATMAVDRTRSDAERIITAYHRVVLPRIQPVQSSSGSIGHRTASPSRSSGTSTRSPTTAGSWTPRPASRSPAS